MGYNIISASQALGDDIEDCREARALAEQIDASGVNQRVHIVMCEQGLNRDQAEAYLKNLFANTVVDGPMNDANAAVAAELKRSNAFYSKHTHGWSELITRWNTYQAARGLAPPVPEL